MASLLRVLGLAPERRTKWRSGDVRLLLASFSPSTFVCCSVEALRNWLTIEMAVWSAYYPEFVPEGVEPAALAAKIGELPPLEVCSIVDSLANWHSAPDSDLSRDSLSQFFHLSDEDEEVSRG